MINFLKIVQYSFISRDFYKDVFNNLKGLQVKYLFLIIAITVLPIVIRQNIEFNRLLNSSFLDQFSREFPVISIKSNSMVTKFEPPYTIKVSERNAAVFISEMSQMNKMKKMDYPVIFGPHDIQVMIGGGYTSFNYEKMIGKQDGVVDKYVIKNTAKVLRKYGGIALFVISYPITIAIESLQYAVEILLFAVICRIFMRRVHGDLPLSNYFRLLVFAFIPSICIKLFSFVSPAILLGTISWASTIAKIFYSYFAIKSASK